MIRCLVIRLHISFIFPISAPGMSVRAQISARKYRALRCSAQTSSLSPPDVGLGPILIIGPIINVFQKYNLFL